MVGVCKQVCTLDHMEVVRLTDTFSTSGHSKARQAIITIIIALSTVYILLTNIPLLGNSVNTGPNRNLQPKVLHTLCFLETLVKVQPLLAPTIDGGEAS